MISPEDAATIRTRARVGLVLKNKWRIESLLGVGGMAAVYVATHVNNGRRVAIKMLHPELSMNTELRTRFLREGYVANRIAHSGAVAILDDDVAEDGSVYLVMELLEGETIETRRLRKGGTLEPNEILSICDQVLAVLAAAHDKGVVHRDVKPDNIFLTKEGGVKLLDFGIARMRELTQATATMTGSGAMGTPAFMPPEQARGRKDTVGPRTDVWALGATMYTLATGRCVHEAETLNELLLAAMTKPAPALATVASVASVARSMPPPFCALIDRALAYEIDQRWADAGAMQHALREAYQAMAASDGPSTNRGIGPRGGVEERSGMMPAGALITGPRPPPEFTPPPFKVSDAVRDAVNRLPPQNDPSTTSGVVFPSTSSGAFGSPGYGPYGPIAAPPPGMVGVHPAFASHATAQPVALGTTRPARNRGVGIAVVAAGAFTFAAAFGVYVLLRGDATPPVSEVASAAPSTALPAPASTASPVESATAQEAPSAEPSATAVASAEAAPTPAASTAAPIQKPVVATPVTRQRPWLRPSTSPSAVPSAGKQRDPSNRHN